MGPIKKVNKFHDLNELRHDWFVSGGLRRGEFNGEVVGRNPFFGSFNRTRSSYDYLAADADITFDR